MIEHGSDRAAPRLAGRAAARMGVVIIGRNEGERLRRCLESVVSTATTGRLTMVYVDSASTDGSVALAQAIGAVVVALDMSRSFTAARARNAGFRRLLEVQPGIDFVQFVDGDCEFFDGWLAHAAAYLDGAPGVALVCGRLHERHPEHSVYNRMCDVEWQRPVGETAACGGIFMVRRSVFEMLEGFREDIVAGEEPELCARVRALGLSVWRLGRSMAWHDAAMLRFSQWWIRTRRTGFGYAQARHLSSGSDRYTSWRQIASAWTWAVLVPLATLAAVWVIGTPALLVLAVYPVQVIRIAIGVDAPWRVRLERGSFLMLGKWPEAFGHLTFWFSRQPGRRAPTFDYKQ